MNEKYELLQSDFIEVQGHKLFRIKALMSFDDVEAGELGGFVESECNLSSEGDAWVYNNAQVFENAKVYGNAQVYGDAQVRAWAEVYDNAQV